MFPRFDPGPCPICGAAHSTCGGGGPIQVVQLPARDAASARALPAPRLEPLAAPPAEDAAAGSPAPLGDGTDGKPFSTATYRGRKHRRT